MEPVCVSYCLSPPLQHRWKLKDAPTTTLTQMRAINVPLMYTASAPGCMENEQERHKRTMMAAFFEEKHEKKERLSPKRVRSTHSFGEESRPCMQIIEKEPKPRGKSKESRSISPVDEDRTAKYYISIRSRIGDQSREARIAAVKQTRQTPGPGEYSGDRPFGTAACGHAPAISRLQCFGTTETRRITEDAMEIPSRPQIPRRIQEVRKRSPTIRKGLAKSCGLFLHRNAPCRNTFIALAPETK